MKRSRNLTVNQVGEFNIIRRIRRMAGRGRGLTLGIGDDAFVGGIGAGRLLAATKDMLVENIHFRRDWTDPVSLGHKAMAVNLSDLAAMGKCRPLYALVGLGLPGSTSAGFVDKLYTGMAGISRKYGVTIVGGDTVSVKEDIVISITLIGEIRKSDMLTRGGAKPGDIILVTGTFGDSGAGLALLQAKRTRGRDEAFLVRKHLLPEPRFREGAALAKSGIATALIDSSDGLAASVRFITEESRAGAVVDLDRIPFSPQLRRCAAKYGLDEVQCALGGGEDYELVCTARPGGVARLMKAIPGLQPVGEITARKGITYRFHGKKKSVEAAGFDHFHS